MEIDRIDNDKGYSKSNCRWVTRLQNNNNKQRNIRFTLNGITSTLGDLSRRFGLHRKTIFTRIRTLGWSVEKAVLTPAKKHQIHEF